MTVEGLLDLYQGQVVPKAYNAGYVALSFLISLVGAASTLELINRRSWFNGISNHMVLGCSAITMGGIAIWCMHFIGNQALVLAGGEPEMQIVYSSGITVLSFFLPVLFLLAAFYAIGISNRVSWLRVITAGILCGSAICGMHYLANASIKNYRCIYRIAYIVGAASIAVVASTVALAMFFIFQSLSASTWWKRTISAIVLAGAVSSMHWCASVGTQYRLVQLMDMETGSRTATVIAVICLSLGACIIIAGSAILRSRTLKQAALRAQQIELGAIVFDKSGRLLVDSSGVFPSTVVTDFFISEFHWMFQASRNWIGISGLINGMKQHLAQLPHKRRHKDARKGIQLITDDGKLIEGYELIFRELFCVAASVLSDRLNEPLTTIGILWDDILPKGTVSNPAYLQALEKHRADKTAELSETSSKDSTTVGYGHLESGVGLGNGIEARGALMFLVRRLTSDDEVQKLTSAGYRFVDPGQVSNNARSHLQIQPTEFELKLRDMRNFVDQQVRIKSGAHLAFFSLQDPGLNASQVLVRKDTRHLLPSVPLHLDSFEESHMGLLRGLAGLPVPEVIQRLRTTGATSHTPQEAKFAEHLSNAISSLRGWVQEPLYNDAVLASSIVRLPFGIDGDQVDETVMMALRLKIHHPVISSGPNCQWVPLNFFKMRQVLEKSRQEFIRVLHHDFNPVNLPTSWANNKLTSGPFSTFRRLNSAVASADLKGRKAGFTITKQRAPLQDPARSSSTINLCPPGGSEGNSERPQSTETVGGYTPPERHYTAHQQPFLNGGIVVFQEVTVQVEANKAKPQNHLAPSWSHETVTEPPRAHQHHSQQDSQHKLPTTQDLELQPYGWGKTDVLVQSRWVNNHDQVDNNITTIASFIDALLAESNNSST
ncbi:hypothetical protein HG530_008341 [Fusarium avenaceum]|nr:hypothetical protein HG530_008341 [Fusarium avenaceum]